MYNDAFERARRFPEHVDHLPLYLDYIDADEGVENAIATHDDRYAFVGITLPLVFRISDVCRDLSQSSGFCATLRVRPSKEDYNELQAVLFYSLLSFVVAHEWAHHVQGHLGQLSGKTGIFQEISDSGLVGGLDVQIKELAADGYAAYFVLSHLFDSRASFLPWLQLDPSASPDFLDQIFLGFFITAVAGYMLLRPAPDLIAAQVYRLTHPPQAARMNLFMREVAGWCSHNRPTLEDWMIGQFHALMRTTSEAVLEHGGRIQTWSNQIAFLKSAEGLQYDAALTEGIAAYRKSWGNSNVESDIIEPLQQVQLRLIRAPDDHSLLSSEYQQELSDFAQSLRAENITVSTPAMGFDAAGLGGGLSGAFIFGAGILTPAAFGQLRKLIEAFLSHRGRKIKLTNGVVKIEGSVEDIKALFTPEQIQKLIEPRPQKQLPSIGAVSRTKTGTPSSGKP